MKPLHILLPIAFGGLLASAGSLHAQSASTGKIDAVLHKPSPPPTTGGLSRSWKPTEVKTTMRRGLKPVTATRSYTPDLRPVLMRDYVEVEILTDAEAQISLPDIKFEVGTVRLLNSDAQGQLDKLAASLLKAPPGSKFLIEGHTCPRGGNAVNTPLSVSRAEYVRDYLLGKKVSGEMLEFIGCGSAMSEIKNLTAGSIEEKLAPFRTVMVHKEVPKVK